MNISFSRRLIAFLSLIASCMNWSVVAAEIDSNPIIVFSAGLEGGYAAESGTMPQGEKTDAVVAYLNAKGVQFKLQPTFWAAAYRKATTQQRLLIYPLTRTAEREDQFEWLHPLKTYKFTLVGKASLPRKVTAEDIKQGKYVAICERLTIACTFLRKLGFPEEKIVKTYGVNIHKMMQNVAYGRAHFTIEADEDIRIVLKRDYAEDHRLRLFPDHFIEVEDYLAYRKDNPELDKILKKNMPVTE